MSGNVVGGQGTYLICYQNQGKVREFRMWSISMHICHHLANNIWTGTKSPFISSFKYHSPNDFFLNFIRFHVRHNILLKDIDNFHDFENILLCWPIFKTTMLKHLLMNNVSPIWFWIHCEKSPHHISRQWLEFVLAVREVHGKSGNFFSQSCDNPDDL